MLADRLCTIYIYKHTSGQKF